MINNQTPFLDKSLLIEDHERLWIPDGYYVARVDHWRTFKYKGDPRVEFSFKILGEIYHGVCIGFFSGVRSVVGNGSIGGEFVPSGRQSNLGKALRQLAQMTSKDPTISDFIRTEWEVKVISIEYDSQKNPLREGDIYSKVQSIRPIEIGW